MDGVEDIHIQAGADLCQLGGQVGVDDVALQGEAVTAAAHARDHFAIQVNGLAAVDGLEVFTVQHQGAELVLEPGSLLLDQRLATDEIALVQVDAEAQPG